LLSIGAVSGHRTNKPKLDLIEQIGDHRNEGGVAMRWRVPPWLGIASLLLTAESAVTYGAPSNLIIVYAVAALEVAGVSAPTKRLAVTTAARETGGEPAVFAPYIDMGLVSSENLPTMQRNSQIKIFTRPLS
jgi:hypothetical protein